MSKDQRRLGRGLSSLISIDHPLPPLRDDGLHPEPDHAAHDVPLDRVRPNPFQPRTSMDPAKLEELAASVRQAGILQPLLVRQRGDFFEIITGERRLRAAHLAGCKTVPVLVRDADEQQMLEMALIENIQRDDLNPIDRANAYRQYRTRFGLSVQDLASRLGEDRSTVTNMLRLLDLPQPIKDLVIRGELSAGHARCLLGVPDQARQINLAERAAREGWPVRKLEAAAKTAKQLPSAPDRQLPPRPHIAQLEQRLAAALGTKVRIIESRKRNTGRLVIDYYSLDDFDRITGRLGLTTTD